MFISYSPTTPIYLSYIPQVKRVAVPRVDHPAEPGERFAEPPIAIRDERPRLGPCLLQDGHVARQVGDPQRRQSVLPRSQQVAGAAQLKVELRQLKAVVGRRERFEPR